jgi:hypothetical protein
MTRDILTIAKSEAEVKRLFNQERDITHYRRNNLRVKTMKMFMMIRIHTNKNENNFALLKENTSKDQLHLDQQDQTVYIKADLTQNFESTLQIDDEENLIIDNVKDEIDFVLKSEEKNLSHRKKREENQFLNLKRKRANN